MTKSLQPYRYEVKFVCPPEARDRFDLWLHSKADQLAASSQSGTRPW